MATKEITFKLTIDGKNFEGKLDVADQQIKGLKKSTQGVTDGMAKWSMIVTGFNQALAIGRKVLNMMGQAIDAYKVQEQAEKQLSTALGSRSQMLLDYASAMQQVTIHGDEEIIRAQSLIAAFVKDEEQIKSLTAATLDFADAKGISLATAADLLSKTIGSSTNALTRYGIEVTGAVGSSERLDSLLEGINDKFGGQAMALAETDTGKLTQAQNELGDSLEKVGKLFTTVLAPLQQMTASIMTGLTNAGMKLIGMNDKLSDSIRDEQTEFNALIEIVKDVNIETDTRNRAIKALNDKYGSYLGNLNLEKAAIQDIAKAQREANVQFLEKIKLTAAQEQIKEFTQDLVENQKELFELELESNRIGEKIKKRLSGEIADKDIYDKATQNYVKSSELLKRNQQIIEQSIKDKKKDLDEIKKQTDDFNAYLKEEGINLDSIFGDGGSGSGSGGGGTPSEKTKTYMNDLRKMTIENIEDERERKIAMINFIYALEKKRISDNVKDEFEKAAMLKQLKIKYDREIREATRPVLSGGAKGDAESPGFVPSDEELNSQFNNLNDYVRSSADVMRNEMYGVWDGLFGKADNVIEAIGLSLLNMLTDAALQKAFVAIFSGPMDDGLDMLFGFVGSVIGLADGAIVTKPTLAVIGEGREPEAVLPLSELAKMINITGGSSYDSSRLEKIIDHRLGQFVGALDRKTVIKGEDVYTINKRVVTRRSHEM